MKLSFRSWRVLKQRKVFGGLGMIVIGCIWYGLLWSPLQSRITEKQQQIQARRVLLDKIQPLITSTQLAKSSHQLPSDQSPNALQPWIQSLKNNVMGEHITVLKPIRARQLDVVWAQVDFDEWLRALMHWKLSTSFSIVMIDVNAQGDDSFVDIHCILEK